MNILSQELPDYIEILGVRYPIYTDFRRWIEISIILSERNITFAQRAVKVIILCYKKLPENIVDAFVNLLKFYNMNNPINKNKNNEATQYSFIHDASYIYSAFYKEYGIDLSTATLHWWQFRALFMCLGEDNLFMQILKFRCVDLSKIKDSGQKRFYRDMKRQYKLPDLRGELEMEEMFYSNIEEIF